MSYLYSLKKSVNKSKTLFSAPFQTIAVFWQLPTISFSHVYSLLAHTTVSHCLLLKLFLSQRKNKNSYPSLKFRNRFLFSLQQERTFPSENFATPGSPIVLHHSPFYQSSFLIFKLLSLSISISLNPAHGCNDELKNKKNQLDVTCYIFIFLLSYSTCFVH